MICVPQIILFTDSAKFYIARTNFLRIISYTTFREFKKNPLSQSRAKPGFTVGELVERPFESVLPPLEYGLAKSSLTRIKHLTSKKKQLGSLLGDIRALHRQPFTGLGLCRSISSLLISLIHISVCLVASK